MTTSKLLFLSETARINWGEYALGLLSAVAVCIAIYLILMVIYFVLRRKNPSAKYWIETVFVLIAMILSVGIKLAVLPDLSNDAVDSTSFGVVEYMGYALSAIYSMIGGLSFEGLPFGVGDIGQGLNVCLYYGSSIVAGLIVLSVITAKASYEIFSLVTIRFLRRRRTVYVFNGLTKDSLLLAQNIAEHHQDDLNKYKNEKSKNTKTEKPRKALIIFAGNNISAFSRTEPLCRDVMSNSFYYYSLMKGKDTKKSLLTTLGLRRNNVSLLTVQPENALNVEPKEQSGTNESRKAKEKIKGSLTRIAEFYFTLDDDKKPMQEKNTTDAFSEVDFIVNDLFYGKKPKVLLSDSDAKRLRTDLSEAKIENADSTVYTVLYRLAARNAWTITEQYVLTHGDINYQYYTSQITERVEKIKEHLLDLSLSDYFGKKNAKKVYRSFVKNDESLNIQIEKITLRELLSARKDEYGETIFKKFEKALSEMLCGLLQVNLVNEGYLSSLSLLDERYKKLGSQSVWDHLGSIDDEENVYKVLILGFGANGQSALHALYFGSAHINDADELTGFQADVFDKDMTDIEGIFAKNHPLYRCYDENEEGKNLNADEIKAVYKGFYDEKDEKSFEVFCKKMSLPKIFMHDESCASFEFIDFFDSVTGTDGGKNSYANKSKYNIIVIAFGSDSFNISIANTIINDIKREYYRSGNDGNGFRQCIAVNIRDKENLRKLDWDKNDFEKGLFKNVVVFPFGAKEDLYTFDKIVDYSSQYEFNTNYFNMSQKIDTARFAFDSNGYDEKIEKTLSELCNVYGVDHSNDYENLFKKIYEVRKGVDKSKIDSIRYNLNYFKLSNYKKETNRASYVYSKTMRRAIKKLAEKEDGTFLLDAKTIGKLLVLEHDRWNRFAIANGWVYAKSTTNESKLHKYLLPMPDICAKVYAYDLINVVPQSYMVYNHSHILYKNVIKNCGSKDKIEKELYNFLSYCFKANGLDEKACSNLTQRVPSFDVKWNGIDASPITFYFPAAKNNDGYQPKTILFALHYDIYAAKTINGEIKDNVVYVADDSVPEKAYSAYGGADDLAGVASVLFGVVSAIKSDYAAKDENGNEPRRRRDNVIVLITGAEEYGSKGVTALFEKYGSDCLVMPNEEKTKIDACVVVDINDRIGVYDVRGSALSSLKIKIDEKNIKELTNEYKKTFSEDLKLVATEKSDEYSVSIKATAENDLNKKIDFVKKFATVVGVKDLAKPFDCSQSAKDLVERYRRAAYSVGITPKIKATTDSFSDANVLFDNLKSPCILVSSGAINAHKPNEFIYSDDLEKNAELIKEFLLD